MGKKIIKSKPLPGDATMFAEECLRQAGMTVSDVMNDLIVPLHGPYSRNRQELERRLQVSGKTMQRLSEAAGLHKLVGEHSPKIAQILGWIREPLLEELLKLVVTSVVERYVERCTTRPPKILRKKLVDRNRDVLDML